VEELRSFLEKTLPTHMVPAAFVFLDSFPLTSSGKLDRRSLPAPDSQRPALEQGYVPPRNPVETALARIWAEVLGLDQVGVHDDFFDLGGHSLLATQILSRVREAFDANVPLRLLFEKPTVATLAAALLETAPQPERVEKTAELLLELGELTEEELERQLEAGA
jgi:acyl carrier protein